MPDWWAIGSRVSVWVVRPMARTTFGGTKVALIYKRIGNLRAVQILLGHTKLESTVRYLGVDAEDALTLSEATEI
jgi:site-specific recombinase XerC